VLWRDLPTFFQQSKEERSYSEAGCCLLTRVNVALEVGFMPRWYNPGVLRLEVVGDVAKAFPAGELTDQHRHELAPAVVRAEFLS